MANIGEKVDVETDLIFVSEGIRENQAVWDVLFIYREEKPTCDCTPIVLEDGTILVPAPNPGFAPDSPSYGFSISKTDGQIVDEGFADLTPDEFIVPCVLN